MLIKEEDENIILLPPEQFCNTASTSGDIVHVCKEAMKRKGSINIYNNNNNEDPEANIVFNLKPLPSQPITHTNYGSELEFKQIIPNPNQTRSHTVKKEAFNWKDFFNQETFDLSDISSLDLSSSSQNKSEP